MIKSQKTEEELLKIQRNTVIHCQTKELAERVTSIFTILGFTWLDGESYKDNTKWHKYEKDTCYNPATGGVCTRDFYINELNSKVITAEEFISLHLKTDKGLCPYCGQSIN